MIDLDPLGRLALVLGAFAALPLLLSGTWAARKAEDSCTVVLLRSWCRGHRRRKRRRHTSTPAQNP